MSYCQDDWAEGLDGERGDEDGSASENAAGPAVRAARPQRKPRTRRVPNPKVATSGGSARSPACKPTTKSPGDRKGPHPEVATSGGRKLELVRAPRWFPVLQGYVRQVGNGVTLVGQLRGSTPHRRPHADLAVLVRIGRRAGSCGTATARSGSTTLLQRDVAVVDRPGVSCRPGFSSLPECVLAAHADPSRWDAYNSLTNARARRTYTAHPAVAQPNG